MTTISFKKAERKQAKARIAFCAPAGGGKTHSSLLVAAGLGSRIAVIDTENGSASLEAGKPGIPEFDVLTLQSPFTVEKYIEGMKAAEAAGYDVIVLDSLSHAWQGTGGLLDQMDMKAKASNSKSTFDAWRHITPMHNELVETILQSKCHVIATMRTKVEYAIEKDEKTGKNVPKKLGLAPIQREGMDYEFTIVFDVDQTSHVALASKDRTSLFDGKPFTPTVETGRMIHDWIMSGAEEPKATPEQLVEIESLVAQIGSDRAKVEEWIVGKWKVPSAALSASAAAEVIEALALRLKSQPPAPPAPPAAPAEAPMAPAASEPARDPARVDYLAYAKACKDQQEAGELIVTMLNNKESVAKVGAVKGILTSRGFNV